jgi:arylsulfatase A-like enzyme
MKKYATTLAMAALLLMPLAALFAAEVAQPNMVYFLIDDQGYADVGFNGCEDIRTPNIDKLAKQGAILDCFYGQPVCSPTRAALMTGRYPTHTGIYNVTQNTGPLPLAERTLAQALREAGYTTAISGKWHLGLDGPEYLPTQRGFDHQYGFMDGGIDSFALGHGNRRDWYRDDKPSDDTGYSTHLIAKEACRIIREQPAGKPLFLYVAPNAVHTPLLSPDEYKTPYEALSKQRKEMAGMTAAVDEAIGQVMAALDAKGLAQNTLIIYSSDNGGISWSDSTDNGPLRGGKSDIYEGGIRLCSFVTWTGKIPAGIHITEPIHAVDWYPTLCKLAGASLVQDLAPDGLDIWPVITQGAKSPHDAILLMGSREGQRAIRIGDWKLLVNPGEFDPRKSRKDPTPKNPVELYNVVEDIGEMNNLAAAQPERVKKMMGELNAMTAGAIPNERRVGPGTGEKKTKAKDRK